jgi:thioredoxin reductase (NADPH)
VKDHDTLSSLKIDELYDCIIIGAGPGGLQAAIYLGRYNRKVLLLDRGGGRTAHAKSIENFLTQKAIPGIKIIDLGMEQARSFNVGIEKGLVTSIVKKEYFEVTTRDRTYRSRFVIVSTGLSETIPPIENVAAHFGTSFFTCIDCDGYRTRGKKLVVMGGTIEAARLALAMRDRYTEDVTLVLSGCDLPPGYEGELRDQGIPFIKGEPARVIGSAMMEAVELKDGTRIPCEAIMSHFGYRLNDAFLSSVDVKRSRNGSIVVNTAYESSVHGMYVVGPLNTGYDQAVIAAGEGAVAAIEINKQLFEF